MLEKIMSLVVTVYVPSGIVMAGDSRMSVQRSEERAEGEQRTLVQQQLVLSDSAYKVVEIRSIGVGIAIYDAGIINNQPADTHVHRFEEEMVTPEDDVLSVADKFLAYFQQQFPGVGVGYHIAGYRTENRASTPYVLVGHTVREPGLRRVNADSEANVQYGITRAGDTLVANRLIDQNYLPLFPAMPLQDAVDYAVHLIRTTIDTMRFEPRFPSVGGPIDVLVVTPDGLQWVQRKELQGTA
jgi:hypothetical protein